VRNIHEVPQLEQARDIDREQLKLARHLVETMATTLDTVELKDRYFDAMREIIDAKIAGREVVTTEVEEPKVVDIMTALKASIEQAKSQRQPMIKATGKPRKGAKVEKGAEENDAAVEGKAVVEGKAAAKGGRGGKRKAG
jgi:DNA end-binding protein Ku